MLSYQFSSVFTKIGFLLTFMSNFFLIYLTLFHIKNVFGTYRRMVIYFTTVGIIFAGLEIVARPFAQNYNQHIMYFSLNEWIKSQELCQVVLVIWAGIYIIIVAFISVQFYYRYVCLLFPKRTKNFDGWKTMIWMGYPFLPASIYAGTLYFFCLPDENGDESLKDYVLEHYHLDIKDIPRFEITPLDANGLRLKNVSFMITGLLIMFIHYFVILYCGLRMNHNICDALNKMSQGQQKIQRQFFRALVIQSLGPTIFLILPVAPIFAMPFVSLYLDIAISVKTGWLYSLVGLFPPFDSISFMWIVSEYRRVIKNKLLLLINTIPESPRNTSQMKVIDKN
ncbi:Protein CBG25140 [Caenorhabditis briggsae]|uniref:Protein CBG25140 n=1 Tax=Caenorhabditis briggsae TaxID=6238 RepID=A8WQ69_CAEBR|nr:Protein CBG25140 [Caenorhabditis briggsae]CAP22627.2 Protein CBG25140 [Caenorhabditis briggsae]